MPKNYSANKSRVEFLVDKQQWEIAKCRAKIRVSQGFWVYGIQGLFKSGLTYIAAYLNTGIRYITFFEFQV